jgi:menaquinone-dependent protoporphyrinogen oxidase
MRILVSTASKHGSTGDVATRNAERLRSGLPPGAVVDVLPAAEVGEAIPYDGVALGSAVYMGRLPEDARSLR